MTRVWMYVLASSPDPDQILCPIPYRVDERAIFFGPCKRRIREHLRSEYLGQGVTYAKRSNGPFIVGVNGSNPQRIRKVVFAGRVCEVMTFAEAHRRLRGERFWELREHRSSPLHVRPIVKDENLVCYEHEHVSDLHIEGWVEDLVSDLASGEIHRGDLDDELLAKLRELIED